VASSLKNTHSSCSGEREFSDFIKVPSIGNHKERLGNHFDLFLSQMMGPKDEDWNFHI
jgi:hypothetical protein